MANLKFIRRESPLRPIFNTLNSPIYELVRFLTTTLQPFIGNSSSFIKYSSYFTHFLHTLKLEPTNILVIFYVISLFTKIPINEAIDISSNFINHDITNLIKICLKSTLFSYEGQIYEQTK